MANPISVEKGEGKSNLGKYDMDEAYRRLGHRLSLRAQGDQGSSTKPETTTQWIPERSPTSAFFNHSKNSAASTDSSTSNDGQSPYSSQNSTRALSSSAPASHQQTNNMVNGTHYDRTHKVAKMHLKDHGEHHSLYTQSLLKKVTYQAKDTFQRALLTNNGESRCVKGTKKRVSPSNVVTASTSLLTPQKDLSNLDLGTTPVQLQQAKSKGLLHAALKETDIGDNKQATPTRPQQGKCLTSPSEPVSNHGLDNAEGNLIVHENDVLKIHSPSIHAPNLGSKRHGGDSGYIELLVIELLGQGTFAQVFKCENLATGQFLALKVVKNKPAYTRQAAIEVEVFAALAEPMPNQKEFGDAGKYVVKLLNYFMHKSHLCLVFELLGLNLYDVLKRRQFRGLPLGMVRTLLRQSLEGTKELAAKSIVHCDLKPENILLLEDSDLNTVASTDDDETQKIKLIDFGSASFEGNTAHTYIQSRFYRSPEVLIGLPYDSAIDMWSLGCVAAELFLGLPILPGVHEHDQLGRICEMIGFLPDKMLDEGTKSTKYFCKYFPKADDSTVIGGNGASARPGYAPSSSPPPLRPIWRLKTQDEYINSLSSEELRKKGGKAKLEKQPPNRYFKRKKLADIVMLHGNCSSSESRETLGLFVHFLLGVLDPDPWKRWTAYQASMHPFITGSKLHRRKSKTAVGMSPTHGSKNSDGNDEFDIYWVPPWDPSICKRKLLHVQKTRERQQALRTNRSLMARSSFTAAQPSDPESPSMNGTSRGAEAMSVSQGSMMSFQQSQSAPGGVMPPMNISGSPPASIGTAAAAMAAQNAPYSNHGRTQAAAPPQGYSGSPAVRGRHLSASGGVVPPPLQPPAFLTSSSLSDVHPGVVDRQLHSAMVHMSTPTDVMGANGGGMVGNIPMGQPMLASIGPQSFSNIYYERHNPSQIHREGDLGYALQRPGVVPGLGGDLPNAIGAHQQQHHPAGLGGYVPNEMRQLRSGSFTSTPNTSSNRNMMRRRKHSISEQQHYNMMSASSIHEDGPEYNGGRVPQHGENKETNGPTSQASGTSLLAQQLAEHSATAPSSTQNPMVQQQNSLAEVQQQHHPPGYQISSDRYGSICQAPNGQGGNEGYYYVTNETGVMAPGAPAAVAGSMPAAQTMLPRGSLDHSVMEAQQNLYMQHGAANPMLPVTVPPEHLMQASFEQMQYLQTNGVHWSHAMPPSSPRAGPYRGMSM